MLGIDVGTSEDGAFWLSLLRGLVARGLSGVELVTSDAHQGLKAAIAEAPVATTVRTIFQQPSAEAVHAQHARVVEQLEERFPEAAVMLAEAATALAAGTVIARRERSARKGAEVLVLDAREVAVAVELPAEHVEGADQVPGVLLRAGGHRPGTSHRPNRIIEMVTECGPLLLDSAGRDRASRWRYLDAHLVPVETAPLQHKVASGLTQHRNDVVEPGRCQCDGVPLALGVIERPIEIAPTTHRAGRRQRLSVQRGRTPGDQTPWTPPKAPRTRTVSEAGPARLTLPIISG